MGKRCQCKRLTEGAERAHDLLPISQFPPTGERDDDRIGGGLGYNSHGGAFPD